MFMVMFVLNDPDQLDALLEAWDNAGIGGATILESTGIHRRKRRVIPMRYLYQTTGPQEEGHFTLLAIVDSEELVQRCLEATEGLVGDLTQPNTGIFTAWPLEMVKGLPKSLADGE
jgi:hypothetical protein